MSDNTDLNDLLEDSEEESTSNSRKNRRMDDEDQPVPPDDGPPPVERDTDFKQLQFSRLSETRYATCGPTTKELEPGVFSINFSQSHGVTYTKVPVKIENLVEFPDSTSERVISEIGKFWDREHMFKNFGIPYKRGILLWGPPGSGKSSMIQVIIKDVIDRNGVVLLFENPDRFINGYRTLREIQPEVPVVVIMEDLDEIIKVWGENHVLQILDGVYKIHKTIFLATTNYPQRLKARVVNRPSRFDKRFKIGFPNDECRKIYLETIQGDIDIDIDKWVEDTDGFSFAHLKELFIATHILGDDYDEALETLRSMKQRVASDDSEEFDKNKVGFGTGAPLVGNKKGRMKKNTLGNT